MQVVVSLERALEDYSRTLVDLSTTMESISLDTQSTEKLLVEGVAAASSALSGTSLRGLAHRLGLPGDFVAVFRDTRIRFGSVPANILINLSRTIDVKTQYFIAYL